MALDYQNYYPLVIKRQVFISAARLGPTEALIDLILTHTGEDNVRTKTTTDEEIIILNVMHFWHMFGSFGSTVRPLNPLISYSTN